MRRRYSEAVKRAGLRALRFHSLRHYFGSVAGTLRPVELRTLDAIHLASALVLGDDLAGVLTYDRRMLDVIAAQDLTLLAPA